MAPPFVPLAVAKTSEGGETVHSGFSVDDAGREVVSNAHSADRRRAGCAGTVAMRTGQGESDLSDTLPRMTRLTATEVARRFSQVISRVGAGEEVEVVRNGVPIVQMRPVRGRQVVSAKRWRELMDGAP